MNRLKRHSKMVLGLVLATAILAMPSAFIMAADSWPSDGTPETCPDYHAWTNPESLDTSTNTNNDYAPNWSRLVVDSQGFYHIAYQSSTGILKYGTTRGGGGFLAVQPVDSSQDPDGFLPSLALDANDKAHIVYGRTSTNPTVTRLYYVTNAAGSWSQPSLISSSTWGGSSVGVDKDGIVHVLYAEQSAPYALKYSTFNGSVWSSPITIDQGTTSAITFPTLLFAANNKAFFCYEKVSSNSYSFWWGQMSANGSDIQNSQLVSAYSRASLSMAIDQQGAAYFSYLLPSTSYPWNPWLWIKTNRGGSMSTLLDGTQFEADGGWGTAIAANPDGTVFAAYNSYYYPYNHPNVAVLPSAGCGDLFSVEIKTGENGSYYYPRMAALMNGKAHFVYANASYVLSHSETQWLSPDCYLDCSASASPNSGVAPLQVQFSSTVTPSGTCNGDPTYSWTFGDGESSSLQNPIHTYTSLGVKSWTLIVSWAGTTCSKSGTINVTGAGGLPGDCNGDGVVTIGEVQKAINAFLGLGGTCP